MKKTMKIIVSIMVVLILYALWSFEAWNVNPADWTRQSRGIFSIITAAAIFIIFIAPEEEQ